MEVKFVKIKGDFNIARLWDSDPPIVSKTAYRCEIEGRDDLDLVVAKRQGMPAYQTYDFATGAVMPVDYSETRDECLEFSVQAIDFHMERTGKTIAEMTAGKGIPIINYVNEEERDNETC